MRIFLILLAFTLSTQGYSQAKIAGHILPKVMKVGDQYLKLNGGGVREKMFIDLYIAILYLEAPTTKANDILTVDKPMAIKLKIVSSMVDKDNFEAALRDGFKKSTNNNVAPYKDRIEKLISAGFKEEITDLDIYDLIYQPGIGTTLMKNNKKLVTIEGLDFKDALFGIWLGTAPAQVDLKKKMLGE